MNKNKTWLYCLIVTAVVGLPLSAVAKLGANGTSFNGVSLNGENLNGTSLNGVSVNGTNLNGESLNGISLKSSVIQSQGVLRAEAGQLVIHNSSNAR